MKTVVTRENFWSKQSNLKQYQYEVQLDDLDLEHGHNGIGHSFPCTREQLVKLRQQIEKMLGETE